VSGPGRLGHAARLLVLVGILAAAWAVHASGLFRALLDRLEQLGPWGAPLFVALYVLTCVLFVPSFVFTFSAGALFGLPRGILLSLTGTGLGALAAFLLGRHLVRDWVVRAFAGNREFQAVSAAVGRRGWKIVALARLSPVFPFLIGNYAFGVTPISARAYLLATVLGTIPSTSVYVYAGSLTGDLATLQERARTPLEWALLGLGLVATVALSVYLRRVALVALRRDLPS
jgi:uncharacterized membrane protein YdjX (TVP38/TMEM64 family)